MSTLHARFFSVARSFPKRPFLHERGDTCRNTWTYGDVLSRVEGVARFLGERGVRSSEAVALLCENRLEWVAAYLAAVSRGVTVVPLDPLQSVREWRTILRHSGARGLFCSSRFLKDLPEMKAVMEEGRDSGTFAVVIGAEPPLSDGVFAWDDAADGRGDPSPAEVGEEEIATLAYTSGTTGEPKGVMLSHGNLVRSAEAGGRGFFWDGCVVATILPLNHIYGFTTFLSVMMNGGSLVFYRNLAQETLFRSFAELKPHIVTGVPALFEKIGPALAGRLPAWIRNRSEGPFGDSGTKFSGIKKKVFRQVHERFGGRLRFFGSGGAALDPKLARLFHLVGIPVYEGYGLTETSPLIALGKNGAFRAGSVGRPIDGMEVEIRTHGGGRAKTGEVGEIVARGPGVMKAYYKNPEKTREAIDAQGWFRTGDLGYLDADGFLFISGRLKEVIVTPNGKNVYPSEIERAFTGIPLVKEVCVFGIPRNFINGGGRHGEAVHLEVVADPDAVGRLGAEETEATIKEHVARLGGALPEYQRPKSVGFAREPFPRSSAQKVKKHEVKKARIEALASGKVSEKAAPHADESLETSPQGRAVVRVLEALLPHPVPMHAASTLDMDLGLDSLTTIEFWAAIEKAFAIRIPEETAFGLKVLSHIVDYLKNRPDASIHAAEAAEELGQEGPAAGSWFEILSDRAEESRRLSEEVLNSCPKSRPAFLNAFRFLFQGFGRLEARGLENLPASGPYILAPNHECYLDNLFVVSLLPPEMRDKVAVIGAREFFDKPVTRAIAKLCRVIPVDRTQVSSFVLKAGAQVLKAGKILLMHPEGTRSADGRLLPFKQGAAILADYVQCPIVPVHIEGAHEFWPKGKSLPKSAPDIVVTFGRPLQPEIPHGEATRVVQRDARALTGRLKDAVAALQKNFAWEDGGAGEGRA